MAQEIAKEILRQLGGNRFLMMTGARALGSTENSLSFRVPRARNKITYVSIVLEPSDTYTVRFHNVRGTRNGYKNEVVSEVSDVHYDQLQQVFTEKTGLYTRL